MNGAKAFPSYRAPRNTGTHVRTMDALQNTTESVCLCWIVEAPINMVYFDAGRDRDCANHDTNMISWYSDIGTVEDGNNLGDKSQNDQNFFILGAYLRQDETAKPRDKSQNTGTRGSREESIIITTTAWLSQGNSTCKRCHR